MRSYDTEVKPEQYIMSSVISVLPNKAVYLTENGVNKVIEFSLSKPSV